MCYKRVGKVIHLDTTQHCTSCNVLRLDPPNEDRFKCNVGSIFLLTNQTTVLFHIRISELLV